MKNTSAAQANIAMVAGSGAASPETCKAPVLVPEPVDQGCATPPRVNCVAPPSLVSPWNRFNVHRANVAPPPVATSQYGCPARTNGSSTEVIVTNWPGGPGRLNSENDSMMLPGT